MIGHNKFVTLANDFGKMSFGFGWCAVGRIPEIHGERGLVRHHVACDAAIDEHCLHRLSVLAPIDHWPAALVGPKPGQDVAQAMDRVAPLPRSGSMCPNASVGDARTQSALTTSLDRSAGRLTEQRHVASYQIGTIAEQMQQAVVASCNLFACIKHVCGIDRGCLDRHCGGDLGRQPALHVARTKTVEQVTLDLGPEIVVGRNGVEMTSDDETVLAADVGTCHNVVTNTIDSQPIACPQPGLDIVGDRLFMKRLGRDVHHLGGKFKWVQHAGEATTGRVA